MRGSPARLSRRGLGGLAFGVSAGLLVGCTDSGGGDPSDEDLLSWLRELPGVAQADYVANAEDTTGQSAQIITTPGLPDVDVRRLMDQIGRDYGDHAPPGRPSLHVQLDRFWFSGRTGTSSKPDLGLERILWLRSDGRAVSADGRKSRFTIIAQPGTVAEVALGFDAVAGEKGRATHEVRSVDGWTAMSWSESAGLGWALDRSLVQRIADLELGWGPARAPYARFAEAFEDRRIRCVLDAVRTVPGVAELRVRERTGGAHPELDELVVRTGAGYLAGLRALRATWEDFVSVSLVREPARFIGQRPREVFRGSNFDSTLKARTQATLADLDQVAEFGVGSTFTNLILIPTITDGQLTRALTALTEVLDGGLQPVDAATEPYEIRIYSRFEASSQPVGTARKGTFTRARSMAPGNEILAGQVQRIWERLT